MKKNKIILATDLSIPTSSVTETFAIIAMRGSGKSNTAALMAEGFFKNHLPFCVIDPMGNWWGLRSSANGKNAGLPIPIFGGDHGDLPIEVGSGSYLARLVSEKSLSCVIDVSVFMEGEKKRFLTDFAKELYRSNRNPLHLILEEADDYIPQKPIGRDEPMLLRAFETIVRRGRSRGIGITMITQRSAVLNKNVLTQASTLIALRTASPNDIKAVVSWLQHHGQVSEMAESLPSLNTGEAWVWSPFFLGLMKKVQLPKRLTFDSAATPIEGRRTRPPATLADVDLEAIRSGMSSAIERAKADNPVELRKEISSLKAQIRKLETKPTPIESVRVEEKKIPILDSKDRQLLSSLIKKLDDMLSDYQSYAKKIEQGNIEFQRGLTTIKENIERVITSINTPIFSTKNKPSLPRHSIQREQVKNVLSPASSTEKLAPRQMAILQALAQYEGMGVIEPKKTQIAAASGYSLSGGFRTLLSTLHTIGLVYYPDNGRLGLTESGRMLIGGVKPLTHDDIIGIWLAKLQPRQIKLLNVLIEKYPEAVRKDWLASECGYELSGGFRTLLSTLRTPGLIEYQSNGKVVASKNLWPEEKE